MKDLYKVLKEDSDFRRAWDANINMAFIDNAHQYMEENKKIVLNEEDIKLVAKRTSKYFTDLLVK